MRLDRRRWPAKRRDAFDDIGVECALRQELRVPDFLGLVLEHFDESRADDLALLFGILDTVETPQEEVARICTDERNVVSPAEKPDDLFCFAFAHESRIDEDTGELIANRLMDQKRCDRRIDTSGQSADHACFADLFTNAAYGLRTEGPHVPIRGNSRDGLGEVAQKHRASRSVYNFGMEHRAVEAASLVRDNGEWRVLAHGENVEPLGQRGDAVAVAHPNFVTRAEGPQPLEKRRLARHLDLGTAELTLGVRFDAAAQLGDHR